MGSEFLDYAPYGGDFPIAWPSFGSSPIIFPCGLFVPPMTRVATSTWAKVGVLSSKLWGGTPWRFSSQVETRWGCGPVFFSVLPLVSCSERFYIVTMAVYFPVRLPRWAILFLLYPPRTFAFRMSSSFQSGEAPVSSDRFEYSNTFSREFLASSSFSEGRPLSDMSFTYRAARSSSTMSAATLVPSTTVASYMHSS